MQQRFKESRQQFPEKNISFTFNGRRFRGYILSSTNREPHYHWFITDEDEIKNTLGETVAFHSNGGKIEPVYIASRHIELLNTIKKIIEENLPV